MFDIHKIVKEWKEEAKVKHSVCWGYDITEEGRVLVICTDRPGPFIGFRGERHDRFQRRIVEESKKTTYPISKVTYLESRGIC